MWVQDNPNDKNRQNGTIQYDSPKYGQLVNEENGIARIGTV